MHRLFSNALTTAALSLLALQASAASILVSDSGGTLGYGIGYSEWSTVTAQLNAGNTVTVVPDFSNLTEVLAADALWLDQRWTDGSLTATEIANIAAFIGTGKRVVMFGENDLWSSWNSQVLALVGGLYDGEADGTATANGISEITTAVSTVELFVAGQSSGGQPLFDIEFMSLWGDNALTVLDINWLSDEFIALAENQQLASNVVNWVSGNAVVPLPPAVLLLGSALALLGGLRRRRSV